MPSCNITARRFVLFSALLPCMLAAPAQKDRERPHVPHNVIIFVADGLRRGSVNEQDMPTFAHVRAAGVDFSNSHSQYPTFTTANASVIATGHALGDTGDYSNVIYTGTWLTKPDSTSAAGNIAPFLENDEVLANMNAAFGGNYIGERTLLTAAREKGFNVASVGKLGPTAIQQIDSLSWNQAGQLDSHGAIIVDDSTGSANGIPLPADIAEAIRGAHLQGEAPTRGNGYGESSRWSNGFSGDAQTPGTLDANHVQQQWFADVATRVLLPKFAAENKPFVLLFWSRDPDGTQHFEGDSLQTLVPGINGETSRLGLRNADHDLKQLLDWLDAHPDIKASTDVILTSDHGFATVSRREIAADGTSSSEVSANLDYQTSGREKPQPKGTLPTGFLAVDLGIREHLRVFDPAVRSTSGSSPYAEVMIGGEKSQHPSTGNALLGDDVRRLDGRDATLMIAANGGSDLIYAPSGDTAAVHNTINLLMASDYVGGIFVDDKYCAAPGDCPGALPLSAIAFVGSSKVPRPAILVNFKTFYGKPGDLQSGAQVSDTTLQEGQGMHGGFGRDQTLNNMAAMGPDFKHGFVDPLPVGNIDLEPTIAAILGLDVPAVGKLKGRIAQEALTTGKRVEPGAPHVLLSAPAGNGKRTRLQYQEYDGVRYNDTACVTTQEAAACP